MPAYLFLAKPPDGVSPEEFNHWFDGHVQEILALPGWVAAERLELHYMRGSVDEPPPFTYYVLYEIEGDFDTAMRMLRTSVDSGKLHFEEWFPRMTSAGWECRPLGGRKTADAVK
jgi:hypothetical protein